MGILNVTPDSFSDGGQYFSHRSAVDHALQMIEDGADIIDVGGESTRPGAEPLTVENELDRTIPVIESIRERNPDVMISIDTYKSIVAKEAVQAGADIVNDVSGLTMDENMPSILSEISVPVIIMHINGTPTNMQNNPVYKNLMGEIISFLEDKINLARSAGIKDHNIILDPGIGFGKTIDHNFRIIQKLSDISNIGFPVLIGASRKSFIGLTLDLPPHERIEGTAAAVSAGILNGARIVRVHDVKEMKRVVIISEKIRTAA